MRMKVAVIALALGGCTYRRDVVKADLSGLQAGRQRDALVLHSESGAVRLGPNSSVRFCGDGGCTDWLDAGGLEVDARGVYDGHVGWTWDSIWRAEVESVHGAGTLAALTATAVVTVAYAAVKLPAALLGSIGDGPPDDDDGSDSGVMSAIVAGIWNQQEHEAGSWEPEVSGGDANAFRFRARRRAVVKLLVAGDLLANRAGDHLEGVTVGLRLGEMLEVGAVARHVGDELDSRLTTISGYVGGHFSFDAGDRAAIAAGVDVAYDEEPEHVRIRWGLRLRPWHDLFVGVYPANPVYAEGKWIYPSGVEVGVAY